MLWCHLNNLEKEDEYINSNSADTAKCPCI